MATRLLAQICAVAISLATPAAAGTPLLPPPECDHPYAGRVELVQVPQREVYRICSRFMRNPRRDLNECAGVVDGVCHITMVSHRTSRVQNLDHLYRHGRSHCNCGAWHE